MNCTSYTFPCICFFMSRKIICTDSFSSDGRFYRLSSSINNPFGLTSIFLTENFAFGKILP
jgi:hypothetical protein